ncbi:hypothetical protein FJZ19_03320 [Candidatus Pacearchaeota archaeon]|nr:hypothetical protein [Candidatus Pacearchaeota archaeon]
MTNERTQEIEGELDALREDAENALFNMEQFGLDSYSFRQLHGWKEDFEEGLVKTRQYSEAYLQKSNDVSIAGINARLAIKSCIDYLTKEMVSRGRK